MDYLKVTIKGKEYYAYTLPIKGGTRKRLYSGTIKGLEEKIKNAKDNPVTPKNGTVSEILDYWLVYGRLTKKKYDEFSHIIFPEDFMQKNIKSVTGDDMDHVISVSKDVNLTTSMLHDFTAWANKEKIFSVIPPVVKMRQDKTYYKPMTSLQLLQLRNCALLALKDEKMSLDYRYNAIVLFCASTGLRTQSIPLIKDVIKEGENWYIATDTHRFLIPSMHHFVVEALREEQERTKSVSLFGDTCRATIANFFYSYGKKLNIPNLTPSMVRRAYGSYLIEQGVDFVKLADLLGDNINTLYKTYRDTLRLTSVEDEQKIVNM